MKLSRALPSEVGGGGGGGELTFKKCLDTQLAIQR